jgi:hypothetical protein
MCVPKRGYILRPTELRSSRKLIGSSPGGELAYSSTKIGYLRLTSPLSPSRALSIEHIIERKYDHLPRSN